MEPISVKITAHVARRGEEEVGDGLTMDTLSLITLIVAVFGGVVLFLCAAVAITLLILYCRYDGYK